MSDDGGIFQELNRLRDEGPFAACDKAEDWRNTLEEMLEVANDEQRRELGRYHAWLNDWIERTMPDRTAAAQEKGLTGNEAHYEVRVQVVEVDALRPSGSVIAEWPLEPTFKECGVAVSKGQLARAAALRKIGV